ncbi:MAG: hypothetical protein ABSC64_04790 [Candidatus Korobacteraceae bacterium]|jgi:transposase
MKRTNKHVKETAKPVQPPAYKIPAQQLEEFKAKVLAMRYGELIWLGLDARVAWRVHETGDDRLYSLSQWGVKFMTLVPPLEAGIALRELEGKQHELWPEYVRLLKRNPDELKAFQERYNQTKRLLNDLLGDRRDLLRQGPGAPRKLAERDALIYSLYKQEKKTDQQVANILEHKHGIKMSRQAVRRAYDREEERRRRQAAKLNSR